MSRLKSTGLSGGFDGVCQAPSEGRQSAIAAAGSHRQMIGRIKEPPRPIELRNREYHTTRAFRLEVSSAQVNTGIEFPSAFTRAHGKS